MYFQCPSNILLQVHQEGESIKQESCMLIASYSSHSTNWMLQDLCAIVYYQKKKIHITREKQSYNHARWDNSLSRYHALLCLRTHSLNTMIAYISYTMVFVTVNSPINCPFSFSQERVYFKFSVLIWLMEL